MKKLICLLIAVIAGVVFAEGEYDLAKKLNANDKASLQAITKDNVQAVYDACVANTNWSKAQLVCCVAYTLGNKDMYMDYASKVPIVSNESKLSYWNLKDVMNTTSGTKYKEGIMCIDPQLGIALCKKFIERGDLVSGSLIYYYSGELEKGEVVWYDHMTKELRDYILSVYTPDVVKSVKPFGYRYYYLMYFIRLLDTFNDDSNHSILKMYWDTDIAKSCVNVVEMMPGYFRYDYHKLVLDYSINPKYKINAARQLDIRSKNKSSSESIWSYVFEKGTWKDVINLAWYLDDADKVIDSFKSKLINDVDPVDVDKFIKMIVGLDVEYRKSEVLSILKNINNKCTLKLYDDQATWEPVIAKVRAMIDLRN